MKKVVFIFVIFLFCIMITGCSVKKVQELTDAEKFSNEYNVSKNNPFVYTNINNIIDILEKGTGIFFLASPDNEGSIRAASYILDIAKKENIENIYYYNPNKIKTKNTKNYQKLVEYLVPSPIDDKEQQDELEISIPTFYSVKDGKILCISTNFSNEEEISEDYLTKKRIQNIKNLYLKILKYEECTS